MQIGVPAETRANEARAQHALKELTDKLEDINNEFGSSTANEERHTPNARLDASRSQPVRFGSVYGLKQSASRYFDEETVMFKKFVAAAIVSMFATGVALAQTAAPAAAATAMKGGDCEAKAVGKDGKPLNGAAKSSFMKKCERDAKKSAAAQCETKAVGKDGKPLHGAAKSSFMKKCTVDAA